VQPFCTIAAAAAVVHPGQTVVVEPGEYNPTTISVSGTSSAPITFLSAGTSDTLSGVASIGVGGETDPQDAFVVSGAQDVVISGFVVEGDQAILVDNSSDVTINGGAVTSTGTGMAAIQVTGTSSNVTISRVAIAGDIDVQIDQGVTGAVVTSNTVELTGAGPAVLVTSAPGTDITSNTINTPCETAVMVTGSSPGTYLENNIIETGGNNPLLAKPCTDSANAIAFSVSAASVPQTVANYNLMDPISGGPLYSWDATDYSSLPQFSAATGQGVNDIAAKPLLDDEYDSGLIFWYTLLPGSPAIDSADANSPGELQADQLGDPRADDPSVANTGTGVGYYDRGAVEAEGPISESGIIVTPDPADPLQVTVSAPLAASWATNGPIGTYMYYLGNPGTTNFVKIPSSSSSISYAFSTAGPEQVTVGQFSYGYIEDTSKDLGDPGQGVLVGADYTPVTSVRILDTRSGIGARPGAIPPGGDLTLPITSIGQVSAADITAVVLNVTVTEPMAGGSLTSSRNPVPGPTRPTSTS
jgi:hypothetical protein